MRVGQEVTLQELAERGLSGGQNGHSSGGGLQQPGRLARRDDPGRGALREESEALRTPGHRPVALLEGGFDRGQEALVQDEPGPAQARERAPHELAGGAAGSSQHDDQRVGVERVPERRFDRRLVLVDGLAGGDGKPGRDEGHRDPPAGPIGADERRGADRQHERRDHAGMPSQARIPTRSART